jgi:hypothetical protein
MIQVEKLGSNTLFLNPNTYSVFGGECGNGVPISEQYIKVRGQ